MANSKLKLTGLSEPVTWYKHDDGSEPSWSAAIGIEGLIPSSMPGGYAYQYVLELISSKGNVVNHGFLSQIPGSNSTSTSAAIGGKGIPAGEYTVKISGGGQEDSIQINVPDIYHIIQGPVNSDKPNKIFVNKK